jgi:hypothetical protein
MGQRQATNLGGNPQWPDLSHDSWSGQQQQQHDIGKVADLVARRRDAPRIARVNRAGRSAMQADVRQTVHGMTGARPSQRSADHWLTKYLEAAETPGAGGLVAELERIPALSLIAHTERDKLIAAYRVKRDQDQLKQNNQVANFENYGNNFYGYHERRQNCNEACLAAEQYLHGATPDTAFVVSLGRARGNYLIRHRRSAPELLGFAQLMREANCSDETMVDMVHACVMTEFASIGELRSLLRVFPTDYCQMALAFSAQRSARRKLRNSRRVIEMLIDEFPIQPTDKLVLKIGRLYDNDLAQRLPFS